MQRQRVGALQGVFPFLPLLTGTAVTQGGGGPTDPGRGRQGGNAASGTVTDIGSELV